MKKSQRTYYVWIYVGGDIDVIRNTCRKYCQSGLCVTVEKLEFIYTNGSEYGARIGLVNYPRFPDTNENIFNKARELADLIIEDACQSSYLLVDPEDTLYFTKYEDK